MVSGVSTQCNSYEQNTQKTDLASQARLSAPDSEGGGV